ncbi:MAG TPA: carbohydrate kinase family protein [Candidatus Gastranaerophilales bacterium]|nr:carbohydrate kinase family protein [Candidatus Gastranaerophilales bacterium]
MYDFITIGGATTDTFVQTDKAKIMNLETPITKDSYLCFDYGEKIEMDHLAYDIGGGATNAAVNLANLGFKTGIIVKIGEDLNSKVILNRLEESNIDTSMVIRTPKDKTGFSVILTSFEGDRTVLMHRGANSRINLKEIDKEKIKQTKWIYFASLSGESNEILDEIAEFAEENGINMAFNPGSTQIKRGINDLKKVLKTAEILIMNRSEASAITGIPNKPTDSDYINDHNLNEIIIKLKCYGPKTVVITEGKKGVYAFDGKTIYYAPTFPVKVVSTLGAGDAFASTFTGSMIKFNGDIKKSLQFASINSAQIIQSFGAQLGLKNFDELNEIMLKNLDYKVQTK